MKLLVCFFLSHKNMGLILQDAKCSGTLLPSLLLCGPGVLSTSQDQSCFSYDIKVMKFLQPGGFLLTLRVLQSLKQKRKCYGLSPYFKKK